MTTHWIVEKNMFAEECFDQMIAHLNHRGILHSEVTVIPFVHEIEGKTPLILNDDNVICYGSFGMKIVSETNGWKPGVWSGDNFSEDYLLKNFGDLALNSDARICKFKDVLKLDNLPEIFFIKPNTDSKEFAGLVIDKDEFDNWYQKLITAGYFDETILELDVVVSEPKNIGMEWRVVIVNGKVITGSIYRQYQKVMPQLGMDEEVEILASFVATSKPPAPVFVVDICQTELGLKIVELNTFNCSGLYKCDVGKIIDAVTAYVEGRVEDEPSLEDAYITANNPSE